MGEKKLAKQEFDLGKTFKSSTSPVNGILNSVSAAKRKNT